MSISYTGDPLWATRDALPSGNPDKQVVADDFRAEFDKISSAFALAAPTASPTFTGTVDLSSTTVSYPSSNSLGDVTCDSVINAGNYYSATGSVTANNLIAESTSTLKGNVSCQSQLSVSQIANLNGGGGIYGTWVGSPTFAGSPTFNAGFTIAGGATVSGAFTFGGRPTFSAGLEVPSGQSVIGNGDINMSGSVSGATVAGTTGDFNTLSLSTTGNWSVAGGAGDVLEVDGLASNVLTLKGSTTVPEVQLGDYNNPGSTLRLTNQFGDSTLNDAAQLTYDDGLGGVCFVKLSGQTGMELSSNSNSVDILVGTGSPQNSKSAPVGSLYLRTDGSAGTTLYVKESGTGSTGWVAK